MIIAEEPAKKRRSEKHSTEKEDKTDSKNVSISNFYSKFASVFSSDHHFQWLGDSMLVMISE
jgi:ubiquinone/menaquinone biosynthesis C-methylase UbiE